MSLWQKYKKTPLLTKLLVAMILGIALGIIFGPSVTVIKPLGTVFLNLLKMAALPLVVVNLISGIASLDDPKSFGRVGGKIMVYYFATTAVAIVLGLTVGFLFKPGAGFQLTGTYDGAVQTIPSIGETIVNLIPSNIFASLTSGSFDQIVVFSAFVGITILFLPAEQKAPLAKGVNTLASLFNKMVGLIMGYAPIGICALMASTVGTYGADLFKVPGCFLQCGSPACVPVSDSAVRLHRYEASALPEKGPAPDGHDLKHQLFSGLRPRESAMCRRPGR